MIKNYKIIFWIGLGLFLVPEVFFIGVFPGWLEIKWLPLVKLTEVWARYPMLLLASIALEGAGLGVLLYLSQKFMYRRVLIKYFVNSILSILILCIVFTIYVGYVFAYRVSFP
ncbi:MAG: hypothetical protein KBD66_02475 [Candidatus Doudnabacteria bacterium]|nr:hypothetical protein [Candidatus Doudnabacteria bacterium]